MKNIWKWLFLGLLAIVLIGGIVLAILCSGFHESGVHILGNHALIDVEKNCYFIDLKNGEITGKSWAQLSGYFWNKHNSTGSSDTFYGSVAVAEYPTVTGDPFAHFSAFVNKNTITLSNQGVALGNGNGAADWEYYYIVHILEEDPDLIGIYIIFSEGDSLFAICADSEEQALENYQKYLEKF